MELPRTELEKLNNTLADTATEMTALNLRLNDICDHVAQVDRGRKFAMLIAVIGVAVGAWGIWRADQARDSAAEIQQNRFQSISLTCGSYNELLDTMVIMVTDSGREGLLTLAVDPNNLTPEEQEKVENYTNAQIASNDAIAERSRLDCSEDAIIARNGFPPDFDAD